MRKNWRDNFAKTLMLILSRLSSKATGSLKFSQEKYPFKNRKSGRQLMAKFGMTERFF